MDPGTAMLIAAAIASATQIGGQALGAKKTEEVANRRAKELKRETQAGLYNEAAQRSAEHEAQRLKGRAKLGQKKVQSYQDTADIIRGAFNI
jgi:hypothetical protein